MTQRPAHGLTARQGRSSVAALCLAVLAGCAVPEAADRPTLMSVDGVPMKVAYTRDVLDYTEIIDRDRATGAEVAVTPNPLTSGYAVTRDDGQPTSAGDRDRARQAAAHFCAKSGKAPAALRLNALQAGGSPVWYFGGCT